MVLTFTIPLVSFLLYRAARKYARILHSYLCEALSSRPEIASDLVRDGFMQIQPNSVPPAPGHTHPTAASLRTSAINAIQRLATYCGVGTYCVGMSASDQRKPTSRGSRQWYWCKDTNTSNRLDAVNHDDILSIIDVDYYIDMPHFLSKQVKPVLIYTVVPETATTMGTDNTSFHFNTSGELVSYITGGGRYSHQLWDYGSDSTMSITWFLGIIPRRIVTYAVERKQVGPHRQLILISPIRSFTWLSAWLAYYLLEHKLLSRFNPVVTTDKNETFIRFAVHNDSGTYFTTSRPGSFACATVLANLDDSIASVARLGTTNLTLPTTASWIENNREAAAILTEYHRSTCDDVIPTVFPVSDSVRAYSFAIDVYDQDIKPKLEAFMSPFIHGAFAPVQDLASEVRCVNGRINSLKQSEPPACHFVDVCIDEFAEFVVNGTPLEPVCFEVIYDKQNSVTQRQSIGRAIVNGPFRKKTLKCFIKAEAYQGVKDPRCISTYNDSDKLEMAGFAVALSEHCKQFDWYGPGKTPLEIATRVTDICTSARSFANLSDLERMDGSITHRLRGVDRAVYMKAFVNYRTELNELLKRNCNNIGFLPQGTSFHQGPCHGSGCCSTSCSQTLRNSFMVYIAYRNTVNPHTGTKHTPADAFKALGIMNGDDSANKDLPMKNLNWAASKLGLKLDAAIVMRGERGVNFLSRYYSPNVWYGCPDSMCDLPRQLSKFHTTVRLPSSVSPEEKLFQKATSFYITDKNTPIIGEFCRVVTGFPHAQKPTLAHIASYWSLFDRDVQYPNANDDDWMEDEQKAVMPSFDMKIFGTWLVSVRNLSDCLKAPLCLEIVSAKPHKTEQVIVDSEIIDPAKKTPIAVSEKSRSRGRSKTIRPSRTSTDDERTPLLAKIEPVHPAKPIKLTFAPGRGKPAITILRNPGPPVSKS